MDMFEKGSIVNIKRSDGRVHSAMVSRIHEASRSVTVEWYERGETKGKEVELDMLLELNKPELLGVGDGGPNSDSTLVPQLHKKDHITPAPTNLARNATQGAISRLNMVNGAARTARTSLAPSYNGQSSDQSENIPPQKAKQAKAQPITRMSMTAAVPATAPAPSQIAQPVNSVAAAALGQAGSNPRRSYVVKEVERLKENREKRRAKQAVIREEKNALMNMDPGNPNWELSAMIREYHEWP